MSKSFFKVFPSLQLCANAILKLKHKINLFSLLQKLHIFGALLFAKFCDLSNND